VLIATMPLTVALGAGAVRVTQPDGVAVGVACGVTVAVGVGAIVGVAVGVEAVEVAPALLTFTPMVALPIEIVELYAKPSTRKVCDPLPTVVVFHGKLL
jgi:hypothetical protein